MHRKTIKLVIYQLHNIFSLRTESFTRTKIYGHEKAQQSFSEFLSVNQHQGSTIFKNYLDATSMPIQLVDKSYGPHGVDLYKIMA